MNNYVAASAYNYYSGLDGTPMGQPYYASGGLGFSFANNLYTMGLPNSIVDMGFRFGQVLDGYM